MMTRVLAVSLFVRQATGSLDALYLSSLLMERMVVDRGERLREDIH
jgi:hypothetical protein